MSYHQMLLDRTPRKTRRIIDLNIQICRAELLELEADGWALAAAQEKRNKRGETFWSYEFHREQH